MMLSTARGFACSSGAHSAHEKNLFITSLDLKHCAFLPDTTADFESTPAWDASCARTSSLSSSSRLIGPGASAEITCF